MSKRFVGVAQVLSVSLTIGSQLDTGNVGFGVRAIDSSTYGIGACVKSKSAPVYGEITSIGTRKPHFNKLPGGHPPSLTYSLHVGLSFIGDARSSLIAYR
jgi:hypothetical protein